jgi:hypothetical protein
MNLELTDKERIPIIEVIFSEFIKLNKKSNNFNITEKINDTLFDIKYDDNKQSKKDPETSIEYQKKNPIIEALSSAFLDKIFTNTDLIIYFQRNINIYFTELVARYTLYINENMIGEMDDDDKEKEISKLKKLQLTKLTNTDILFIWKGSTAMKTIYKKYSQLLDKTVDDKYGKYFSKKSDADCAIFINPNNKDAEFHRSNMIILSFLMLNWIRSSIIKDAIENIMNTISFNINYDKIRLNDSNGEKYWGKEKSIRNQKWSFTNISRFDRIIVPIKETNKKTNYIEYYLYDEDFKNTADETINYYKNKKNSFFLSIHDKTLSDANKCDGFNKNFSLIKLKYDILCRLDVTFKDNTKDTIYYLLSNDIIDMAIRTIDDDSLKKDYENINAITQVYQKISINKNKSFNFRSYTLDGFIMDFIYNLFKSPSNYGGCNPMYIAKYESNFNRFFYFMLLKLIYMNINDSKNQAGNIMCRLLIDNIRIIIFKNLIYAKKTNDMVLDYFMNCIIDLHKVYNISYYDDKKELKYNFISNILDELKFIQTILFKSKSAALVKEKPTEIINLNKYIKYKTKYIQLKNNI